MSGILQTVFQNLRSFVSVPGAPTIGTATATSSTTATVAFTAPASNGGSTITLYTATSSPGSVTGTLSQAGSGTITVTGLTAGTSYTFTVKATNAIGQGPASAASNSITTLPVIGQAFGGGYFAGQISTSANGVATHNLVVCDKTVGEIINKKWGPNGVTGITSVIAGPTNSASLAALGSTYEAATFCEAVNTGGYTDWYMPAKNELEVCYYYLKPNTIDPNDTSSGSNANAVSPEPISTNYTDTAPPQTAATNFRTGASSQEFVFDQVYWSSTENNSTLAWDQLFLQGGQFTDAKVSTGVYVRAVRRVAV